jgi:N-acetylglucosaminyldiphosphoundecaprenol N-acetyl-beta-D-mannosaminyltransferase
MKARNLLGFTLPKDAKKSVLEKIKKNITVDRNFQHVVSLNPEIITAALRNKSFKDIIRSSQIAIIDGMGIIIGAKILGIPVGERITGTDLMYELMDLAGKMSLTVVLIGGNGNVANYIAKCYQKKYLEATFTGLEGFKNISQPTEDEKKQLNSIVVAARPSLVFVSFGSPAQELWIERHKSIFRNSTVIGVGGAFDFLSGRISRAPRIMRAFGFEWLYRLIVQPWRLKRQLSLLTFLYLVFMQRFDFITVESN